MNYIHNTNATVIPYRTLVADNPNSSLPADGTEIILTDWYVVHTQPQPAYNPDTHRVVETPPLWDGAQYNQTWAVQALT